MNAPQSSVLYFFYVWPLGFVDFIFWKDRRLFQLEIRQQISGRQNVRFRSSSPVQERSRKKEKVCGCGFAVGQKGEKNRRRPHSTTMEQPSEGRGRDEVLDSMLDWELLVWQLSRAIFENRAGGR